MVGEMANRAEKRSGTKDKRPSGDVLLANARKYFAQEGAFFKGSQLRTKLSRHALQKALRRLEAGGFLKRVSSVRGGNVPGASGVTYTLTRKGRGLPERTIEERPPEVTHTEPAPVEAAPAIDDSEATPDEPENQSDSSLASSSEE